MYLIDAAVAVTVAVADATEVIWFGVDESSDFSTVLMYLVLLTGNLFLRTSLFLPIVSSSIG